MREMGKFKTSIGGQAVMEGISMRGPKKTCLAVRLPDGSIMTELSDTMANPFAKIPIVRGVAALFISLKSGYSCLMKSAELAFPEDAGQEDKVDAWLREHLGDKAGAAIGAVGAVLGALLSVALFVILPTFITGLIDRMVPLGGFKAAVEGLLKVCIFIGYLYGVSRIKDIRRVFQYHGAEHKTIFCYEAGEELTVENVRKQGRFHPRCGTSFMFITLIVSIIVFSFVPWTSTALRALYKLLALPLVMGISYEAIKFAGASDGIVSRILSAPGLWVQRLTVFEPDDSMMEVAIAAMKAVIPDDPSEASI